MGESKIEDFLQNDEKAGTISAKKVSMMNGIIMMNELPKIRSLLRGILVMISAAVGMQIGKMIAPLLQMLF